jgi:hypothetical protein
VLLAVEGNCKGLDLHIVAVSVGWSWSEGVICGDSSSNCLPLDRSGINTLMSRVETMSIFDGVLWFRCPVRNVVQCYRLDAGGGVSRDANLWVVVL